MTTEPKEAHELSPEEVEQAKIVMESSASGDDDFKDAVEEDDVDADGNFKVTAEELAIIRAELACEFPDDYNYLSDSYILSVASKPYSKDPTIRRPLEVSKSKIMRMMVLGYLRELQRGGCPCPLVSCLVVDQSVFLAETLLSP
jgi:hypothetical protein